MLSLSQTRKDGNRMAQGDYKREGGTYLKLGQPRREELGNEANRLGESVTGTVCALVDVWLQLRSLGFTGRPADLVGIYRQAERAATYHEGRVASSRAGA